MASIRTSRIYSRYPDTDVSRFSGGVITGLTGNPILDKPPVSPADLTIMKQTFDDAMIAANKGGQLATAMKNAARVALITALDKDASYVDINCKDDITILLSSGYEAVNTNRAQRVLEAPQILAIEHGQTGELKARIKPDANSKTFVGRIKEDVTGSEFGPNISFASSKKILFKGLKSGVTYVIELCGIGGSTGQSDWSEPATKMAL